MSPRHLGSAALAFALLVSGSARAQTSGIALDQFDPAPAGDTFFGVPSPQTSGHLVPRGVAVFDYAHRPLVASLDGDASSGAVVSAQGFVHIGASLALWNRLLVSASFPVAVLQQGDSPTLGGVSFSSPSGAQIGDLRLGARIRLFGESEDAFQMAAGATFHLPTGPEGAFTGDGGVRLSPELLFGGRVSLIHWSAALRPVFRASDNPASLNYGAGVAVSLLNDRLRIGPELSASTPFQEGLVHVEKSKVIPRGLKSNAEIWLGVRANIVSGLWVGAAGGPGLGDAIGTPTFRAMGLVAWAPEIKKPKQPTTTIVDTDADGLPDAEDGCPHAFGEKNTDMKRNGCPFIDTDEDGVPDAEDVCPEEPGAADAEPKRRGCLPDRDEDGVPDAIDVCPDAKGAPDQNGCPPKPAGG